MILMMMMMMMRAGTRNRRGTGVERPGGQAGRASVGRVQYEYGTELECAAVPRKRKRRTQPPNVPAPPPPPRNSQPPTSNLQPSSIKTTCALREHYWGAAEAAKALPRPLCHAAIGWRPGLGCENVYMIQSIFRVSIHATSTVQ